MKITDVMVWLSGQTKPVKAGEFSWEGGNSSPTGYFRYSDEYLSLPGRFALDPSTLPLKSGRFRETLNKGVFGIFRDSGPDSWGRDLLKSRHGDLDDFDYIFLAGSDGVGAITLGSNKEDRKHPTLEEIDLSSEQLMASGEKSEQVNASIGLAIRPTTSLGGAKPKITVEHQGALWIAKFPERGDSEFSAHNEHVMLSMASELGIRSADSFVHQLPDGRSIIMVKRFDRHAVGDAFSRTPFASAHTVLGLTGNVDSDSRKKSYPSLFDYARRWVGDAHREVGRDIWERMLYNALVSNIDDHARNHGFLYDHQSRRWGLSPAFDIVAFPSTGNVALSLRIGSSGSIATKQSLLDSAANFGVDQETAVGRLSEMAGYISSTWEQHLLDAGVSSQYMDYVRPAFRIAEGICPERFNLSELKVKR